MVPELHPREHDPASLGILHELLGHVPAIAGTQSEYGALVLFGWVGTLVEECISLNITQKVRRQGVTGWTASPKRDHKLRDG